MKDRLVSLIKNVRYARVHSAVRKALTSFNLAEKALFGVFFAVAAISAFTFIQAFNIHFLKEIPKRGGSLTEGVAGSPRYINPLLAFSDTDRDISSLVYSGLLKAKPDGTFANDLAESYEISEDGKIYTFTIKNNAVFHDGVSVTADDVLFTIQKAQDPALKSPRRASWDGVTVEKISEKVIKFTLKQAYAPFIENTTLGILPLHIWKGASADEFAFSQFNIEPIGSGPYKIQVVSRNTSGIPQSITLETFNRYALGEPYIQNITFNFYSNEADVANAYEKGNIESMHSVSGDTAVSLEKNAIRIERYPLPQIFGIFFNQNHNSIFTHKEVRSALNAITNRAELIDEVLKGFGTDIRSPIPNGVAEFESISGTSSPLSIETAQAQLEKAGWKKNSDNIYELKIKGKPTETLTFSIATGDSPALKQAAEIIKNQWEQLGAKIDVQVYEMNDLNQTVIRPRKYDALFFGEVIGRELDLYAFWHSSQRNDPGLNIAMYTNSKTDKLLEDARTNSNWDERLEKYQAFEKEILNDTPAVFTYSPDFIYIIPQSIKGFNLGKIVTPSDRFGDIEKWYIDTDRVWGIFVPKELQ